MKKSQRAGSSAEVQATRRAIVAGAGASALLSGTMALAQSPPVPGGGAAPAGGGGGGGGAPPAGGAAAGPGRAPAVPPTEAEIAAALPLKSPGLEHFSMLVPDVVTAGRFWATLFNSEIHQEPYQGWIRYYVVLKPGPVEPPFGYIAIGDSGTGPIWMTHWCCWTEGANSAAVSEAMTRIGALGSGNGGRYDPDSIALQMFSYPGGLAGSIRPVGRVVEGEPLFEPVNLRYFILRVPDMEKSTAYYQKLFGVTAQRTATSRVWIAVGPDRIALEPIPAGGEKGIHIFAVRVKPYNRPAAERRLTAMGARIIPTSGEDAGALRFETPWGIVCDIVTA